MPAFVNCTGCQQELQIPDQFHGKLVRCPSCKMDFTARLFPDEPRTAPQSPPLASEPTPTKPQRKQGSRPEPFRFDRADEIVRGRDKPVKKSRTGVYVTLGVLGLMAVAVFLLLRPSSRPQPRPFLFDPGVAEKQKPLLNEADVHEQIKPLFDSLGKALRDRDQLAITSSFNVQRLADELVDLQVLPARFKFDANFMGKLTFSLGQALVDEAPNLAWKQIEFKQVKIKNDNEASVSVRCTRARDGAVVRTRWWLCKNNGVWAVQDFEDLDTAERFSSWPDVVKGLPADNWRTRDAIRNLGEGLKLVRTDLNKAEKKLFAAEEASLPRKLEGVRHLLTARIGLLQNKADAALDALDLAFIRNPDLSCVDLYKGLAYNKLSSWNHAENHLRTYIAGLGTDTLVCEQLGTALRGQHRLAEAAVSYRDALQHQPKNTDAFFGLIRSLEQVAWRGDIGPLFEKLDNRRENFDRCAEDRRLAHDGATLKELAMMMCHVDPTYASADYHLALAMIWTGQHDAALLYFEDAVKKGLDPGKRKEYVGFFVQTMAAVGRAVEAYKVVPASEARSAFRFVAMELRKDGRNDDLRQVAALHATKAAGDPLLLLCQGDFLASDGDFAGAARHFARGTTGTADQAFLALFRYHRVLACYYTGQMMTAYQDIGPKNETFQQLAYLCFADMKYEELQTLLDAHAGVEPSNFELLRLRFQMKIRQNRIDEGILLYKAALARQKFQNERRANLTNMFLYEMVRAEKYFEGYEAAEDKKEAFQILANDLARSRDWKELQRLLDVHGKAFPDDHLPKFYKAQLLLAEKSWDKAAAALQEFWVDAPSEQRKSFRERCLATFCKAGRSVIAYMLFGDTPAETFRSLADRLCAEKNAEELLKLIAAHRQNSGNVADLLYYEARASIILNRPEKALPLFQLAMAKQPEAERRHSYGQSFLADMMAVDRGLKAYRVVPDRLSAFPILAQKLVSTKNAAALEELLATHKQNHPADVFLPLYTGELHLLRGEYEQAERTLQSGLAQYPIDPWQYRDALRRVALRFGKAAAAYREAGATLRAFEDLAYVCIREKNAQQLELLIAAHRQSEPECVHLAYWEVEAKWLRGEHEAVLRLLKDHHELFDWPRYRWNRSNHQVRCLVKLKRFEEAVQAAANAPDVKQGLSAVLLVLAHAASGDVKQTMAALDRHRHQFYLVDDCYRDNDLGPILRSEAFRDLAEKYLQPKQGHFGD